MAQQFRIVRCDMWRKDEWFTELEPDAKLVWIYTFTNEATSPAGIYRIALRTIANETGIAIERVREIIALFEANDKLYYEDGVIWPVTMRKHQCGELKPNDNLVKKIRSDLAELKPSPIVDRYMSFYGTLAESADPLPTPLEAPSKAVRLTDTDTNTDHLAPAAQNEALPEQTPELRAVRAAYDACGILLSKTHLDAHLETIKRLGLSAWQLGYAAALEKNKHNIPAYVARCAESAMLAKQNRSNGTKPPEQPAEDWYEPRQ
jgi:hypothetical protein